MAELIPYFALFGGVCTLLTFLGTRYFANRSEKRLTLERTGTSFSVKQVGKMKEQSLERMLKVYHKGKGYDSLRGRAYRLSNGCRMPIQAHQFVVQLEKTAEVLDVAAQFRPSIHACNFEMQEDGESKQIVFNVPQLDPGDVCDLFLFYSGSKPLYANPRGLEGVQIVCRNNRSWLDRVQLVCGVITLLGGFMRIASKPWDQVDWAFTSFLLVGGLLGLLSYVFMPSDRSDA